MITLRSLLTLGAVVVATHAAHAFSTLGWTWPSGTITMRLQLDAASQNVPGTFPLRDGSTSWNAVAQAALNDWNAHTGRSRFTAVVDARPTAADDDGVNNVIFSASVYGREFTGRALAVTVPRPLDDDADQVRFVEADVVVNTAYTWNAYRGTIQQSPVDLRRVLVHEFGHVLGLDHPDEDGQTVTALMNHAVSSLDALQADDIAGFNALYNVPFARPTITAHPASRNLSAGEATRLEIAVDGRSPPSYDRFRAGRWFYKAPGETEYESLFTLHSPGSLDFLLAQPLDSGDYYYRIATPDHTEQSAVASLRVNAVASTPATALANLSTRGFTSTGANALIVGFTVVGPRAKTVLLRAIGPRLAAAPFNVPGTLFDPQLSLQGVSPLPILSAPIWDQSPDAALIRDTTARAGAFALPPGSRDAVLVATLPPGSYTARVTSPNGSSGVVLVEAYDADPVPDPASRLMNLSTRGFVTNGATAMIAGFAVRGTGPRTYLVRAVGDTLKSFGVTGTLDDPVLKIYRSDSVLVRELDDWDSPATAQPALRAAFQQVGAFALTDRQESAMLVTLQPGNYTAEVSGFVGGSSTSTGIALVELYEMP